jgi:hypothetical protein
LGKKVCDSSIYLLESTGVFFFAIYHLDNNHAGKELEDETVERKHLERLDYLVLLDLLESYICSVYDKTNDNC